MVIIQLPLCLIYPVEYQGGAERLGLKLTGEHSFWWRTMSAYEAESPLEIVIDGWRREVNPDLDELLYREEESRQVGSIHLECGERRIDLRHLLVVSMPQYTFDGLRFHIIHTGGEVDCDELGDYATESYFIGSLDGYYPKDCYKRDATAYFCKVFHGLDGYISCLVKYRLEEIAKLCPALKDRRISLTMTKDDLEVVVFSSI